MVSLTTVVACSHTPQQSDFYEISDGIMTAFKYRMRMGYKDDINVDMQKEQWYPKKNDELLTKLK